MIVGHARKHNNNIGCNCDGNFGFFGDETHCDRDGQVFHELLHRAPSIWLITLAFCLLTAVHRIQCLVRLQGINPLHYVAAARRYASCVVDCRPVLRYLSERFDFHRYGIALDQSRIEIVQADLRAALDRVAGTTRQARLRNITRKQGEVCKLPSHPDCCTILKPDTLGNWERGDTERSNAPKPQSLCFVEALAELTGIDVSIDKIIARHRFDPSSILSLEILRVGPLNEPDVGDEGQEDTSRADQGHLYNLRDFRLRITYGSTEFISANEERFDVWLGFRALEMRLIDCDGRVQSGGEGTEVFELLSPNSSDRRNEGIEFRFAGSNRNAWHIHPFDKSQRALKGKLYADFLCNFLGSLGSKPRAALLAMPDALKVVEISSDPANSVARYEAEDEFRQRLVEKAIGDELRYSDGLIEVARASLDGDAS